MGNDYYQTVEDLNQLPDNQLLGIGNNCFIQNAIIDKNAKVGHDVTIIGDASLEDAETDNYCMREGIVIVKKAGIIERGATIGLPRP
jgi:glucose-1-phosphate adenylyltransferase